MSDQLSNDLAQLRIDRDGPSGPSPLRKLVMPLLVVGLLGAGAYVGWQRLSPALFKQEVRTTEVSLISPSQSEVLFTATGYAIPQLTSKVGSKLPGRLAKVNIKEGDDVKAGDVIAQLEDADQKASVVAAGTRVGVAQARIQAARANLAELAQQITREKALVESGTVGRANLENMEARHAALAEAVKASEAEATAAQADVGTVGIGLKDRIIVSPISGRVVTKPATVGEFVGGIGNVGLIAEIVDFSSIVVETDVPEARLHMVKLGGPAEIVLDAYPNKRYRGVVETLGQRVNRSKATVMVKVKFVDDTSGVLPEMSARVSFLSKAIEEAALKQAPKKVVAKDAVVDRAGEKLVFAVDNGRLRAMPVRVAGPMGDTAVELADGPPPGVKVVAQPTIEMQDGTRVKENDK